MLISTLKEEGISSENLFEILSAIRFIRTKLLNTENELQISLIL
jgi:hypothetical protein